MKSIKYIALAGMLSFAPITSHSTIVSITDYNTNSWLIGYELYSSSNLTSVVDESGFGGDGITTTVTPYSGILYMEAPKILDFSAGSDTLNYFNIYTDSISPDPDSPFDSYEPPSIWTFGMSSSDVISNGSASYFNSGDDGSGFGVPVIQGNLSVVDGIFTCIECGIDVTLNLIGLDYSSGSATFNLADSRGLLLEYSDFFDYFDNTRTFAVSSVPVPAAIWMFSSGLIGLIGLSRHRKKHPQL